MTDAALVKLAAVRVMGWTLRSNSRGGIIAEDAIEGAWEIQPPTVIRGWNPLASVADCFMLIDKIGESMSDFTLEKSGDNWTADFSAIGAATNTDRRRAIVLAALAVADARGAK